MALTCYCRHCGHEVPPADACRVCGSKLSPSQAHVTWKIVRTPVLDWMSWNAVMRVILPVLVFVFLLVVWMELLSGGLEGMLRLLTGSLPLTLAALLAVLVLLTLLTLALRGKELLVCTIDSKGMHIERYLPDPTALQLIARLRPPAVLTEHPGGPLLIDCADMAWTEIARVQLWTEKSCILLYSPAWWQRMTLPAAPTVWNDALEMLRQKLGKRKDVILPAALRPAVGNKPAKLRSAKPAAKAAPTRSTDVPLPKPIHANQHARPFEGMEQPAPQARKKG